MEIIEGIIRAAMGWMVVFMFISAVIVVALAIRKHLIVTRNKQDINPCPRCGGEAVVIETTGETVSGEYWFILRCEECGYSDKRSYNNIETAIKEWDKKRDMKTDKQTTEYVYEFLYNPCTCESVSQTVSIHKTQRGAEMAMEFHRNEVLKEWMRECSEYPSAKEYPFGFHKDWSVRKSKLMP